MTPYTSDDIETPYTSDEIAAFKKKHGSIPPIIYQLAQHIIEDLPQNKTCPKAYQAWKAQVNLYTLAEAYVLKSAYRDYARKDHFKIFAQTSTFEAYVNRDYSLVKHRAQFMIQHSPTYHDLVIACEKEKSIKLRNNILIGSAVVASVGLLAWGVHKHNSTKRQL